MISKSKLGMLALAAMMSIATAAFAQSLETGTAANYGLNSPRADAISGGPGGLGAFAAVPRKHFRSRGARVFDMVPGAAFDSHSPSATGGGSIGYNSYNGKDS